MAEMYQTNVNTGYKSKLVRKFGEAVRPVQFVWPAHLLSMLKNVYQKNNMHREMVTANMG